MYIGIVIKLKRRKLWFYGYIRRCKIPAIELVLMIGRMAFFVVVS